MQPEISGVFYSTLVLRVSLRKQKYVKDVRFFFVTMLSRFTSEPLREKPSVKGRPRFCSCCDSVYVPRSEYMMDYCFARIWTVRDRDRFRRTGEKCVFLWIVSLRCVEEWKMTREFSWVGQGATIVSHHKDTRVCLCLDTKSWRTSNRSGTFNKEQFWLT